MTTHENGIDLEFVTIYANNGDVEKAFLNGVDVTKALLAPVQLPDIAGDKLTTVTMTFLVNSLNIRNEQA